MNEYNILVVDDEEDICEILQFNLENEGFHVETVFSAEEALTKKLDKYDLFILDIMMSGMSGLKLADYIKSKKKLKTPVMFLTAKDTENDTITGFTVGADDYITKPFSIREVIARVKAILRRSALTEEKKQKNIKLIMQHFFLNRIHLDLNFIINWHWYQQQRVCLLKKLYLF